MISANLTSKLPRKKVFEAQRLKTAHELEIWLIVLLWEISIKNFYHTAMFWTIKSKMKDSYPPKKDRGSPANFTRHFFFFFKPAQDKFSREISVFFSNKFHPHYFISFFILNQPIPFTHDSVLSLLARPIINSFNKL